jgi:hypothetical protein
MLWQVVVGQVELVPVISHGSTTVTVFVAMLQRLSFVTAQACKPGVEDTFALPTSFQNS